MRIFLSTILFIYFCSGFAQTGNIKGIIYGEIDNEPIGFASVSLLLQKDSSFIKGATSSIKGSFNISATKGDYILKITYLGYEAYYNNISITKDSLNIDLGNIYLKTQSIELDEAVIIAKIPDIVVKGDTIEYNVAGYKVDEGSVLQDLARRLPGIEIDSKGNISANGKPINKILVNGKEFFGNDVKIALENIPVEMLDKLQVYKEESDMAKLTGFKDGNETQVLNLKVKKEINQSIFGNVEGGYGTEDRYKNNAFINYMRDDNQFSLVGDMSNINEDSYIIGGIESDRNIGGRLNISKSEKFSINGSINYRNNKSENIDYTNTQIFLEQGDRFTTQSSESNNNKNSFNADSYISWRPDSMTNIFYRIGYQNSSGNNHNKTEYSSFVINNDTVKTNGWSENINNNVENSVNTSLSIGRKLKKRGRSINLSLTGNLRTGDSNGYNQSETHYFNSQIEDLILDQKIESTNNSTNLGLTLAYVEPLGKKKFLQFRYSANNVKSERDRKTYKKENGEYNLLDKDFTRYTTNNYIGQNISVSFQSIKEKYNYTIGLNANHSKSDSKIQLLDSLIDKVDRSVFNISPTFRFFWEPKEDMTVNIDYNGSTTRPSLTQLSVDTIIINAQNKTVGNASLKSGYNNNLNFYFQKSNHEKQSYFNLSGNLSYSINNIVNDVTIDSVGNSITTYRNVTGTLNSNLNFMYSGALSRNKKFKYSTSTYLYHQKNKGYTNGSETSTTNFTLGESLNLSFSADKLNCYLISNISHSIAQNSISQSENISSTSVNLSGSFTWTLPFDFKLNNQTSYTYNKGYSSDFKASSLVWNASISKSFLKKKKGSLRLTCFDILNDKNNILRTVYDNRITDTKSNTLNRFFMLSFTYKFNILKSSKKESDEDYYYESY